MPRILPILGMKEGKKKRKPKRDLVLAQAQFHLPDDCIEGVALFDRYLRGHEIVRMKGMGPMLDCSVPGSTYRQIPNVDYL